MSERFEPKLWRYLISCFWALSTFCSTSWMSASILKRENSSFFFKFSKITRICFCFFIPSNLVALLLDEVGELLEDCAQLGNGRLDVLDLF